MLTLFKPLSLLINSYWLHAGWIFLRGRSHVTLTSPLCHCENFPVTFSFSLEACLLESLKIFALKAKKATPRANKSLAMLNPVVLIPSLARFLYNDGSSHEPPPARGRPLARVSATR